MLIVISPIGVAFTGSLNFGQSSWDQGPLFDMAAHLATWTRIPGRMKLQSPQTPHTTHKPGPPLLRAKVTRGCWSLGA